MTAHVEKINSELSQRVHGAMVTSLWRRQNDIAMSFRHHNDVVIVQRVRWDRGDSMADDELQYNITELLRDAVINIHA